MQNSKLKRQVCVENRNIESRRVVDGVNVRFGCIDSIETSDTHRREDRLHDQPGPDVREPVKHAAIAVEKAERNGYDAQRDGVEPDQRIEKKVGSQSAEQAIFSRLRGLA